MNISMEKKRREALERLKVLGFGTDFLNSPKSSCVKDFESETNSLVYYEFPMVSKSGKSCKVWLYVSDCDLEWLSDRRDLEKDVAMVYIYDVGAPEWSSNASARFIYSPDGEVSMKVRF